jgi:hypothetical protein
MAMSMIVGSPACRRCSGTQLREPAPQERGHSGICGQRNQRRRCRGLAPPVGIEKVQGGHDAPAPFAGRVQGRSKTVRKSVRRGNGAGPRVGLQVGLGVTPAAAWGLGFWFGQHDAEHGQREWPSRDETPRERPSRARLNETSCWRPSKPIGPPQVSHGTGPDGVRRDTWCPVSRGLVYVSLELDQSTRVSHTIWSARRCGPLRRLT